MNFSQATTRCWAFACAALALILAGCSGLPSGAADQPRIYHDLGDSWTTLKRSVRMHGCRDSAMVCTGPASYLNVMFTCRCDWAAPA